MTSSTISISRTVAAAPERVYAAWTDAEQLATWWWPQLAGTTYDVDARQGGRFHIDSPTIGATVTGVYAEVQPPRRLAFTWRWQDADQQEEAVDDIVVVTFEPEDDLTRVTVAHTSSAHVPEGAAEQGWNDVMERLARLVGQPTSSRS